MGSTGERLEGVELREIRHKSLFLLQAATCVAAHRLQGHQLPLGSMSLGRHMILSALPGIPSTLAL